MAEREYPEPTTLIGKIKRHFRVSDSDLRIDVNTMAEAVGEHPSVVHIAMSRLAGDGWLTREQTDPRCPPQYSRAPDGKQAEAREAAATEEYIRALCVGGQYDGKWKNIPKKLRYDYSVPRSMRLMPVVAKEPDLRVGFPEMDRYRVVGPIHLFGEGGICLALERDELFEKYHGSEERMILSAILQRDVAAEMGL